MTSKPKYKVLQNNSLFPKLPQEVEDKIFLYLGHDAPGHDNTGFKTLQRTREFQSRYVRNITKYNDCERADNRTDKRNYNYLISKPGHKLECRYCIAKNNCNSFIPYNMILIYDEPETDVISMHELSTLIGNDDINLF